MVKLNEKEVEAKNLAKDLLKEELALNFKGTYNSVSPFLLAVRKLFFDGFPEINHGIVILSALKEAAERIRDEDLKYNYIV